MCVVSGFLEAAAVVGGPGDPNLQSALTIETSTGKDVTLTAVSPNKTVRALGPENQWLGGEVRQNKCLLAPLLEGHLFLVAPAS